jgi:hypothetical protein
MKPVEIVLRRRGQRRRMMEGVNDKSKIFTYVNITMYPSVQPLYVNKNNFKKEHSDNQKK